MTMTDPNATLFTDFASSTHFANDSTNATQFPSIYRYPHREIVNPCMPHFDPDAELFQFITNGVLINVIGILGILGNVISMIILSRPQMRSSINYLLIGLARCDTVLILTSMFLFGIPAIYPYTGYMFTYYFYILPHLSILIYPLAAMAQTVSVYLTLTVTLERFVAVCHPLRARSLCTYGRAKLYVIVIIVFSIVYNAPKFWEVAEINFELRNNRTVYCAVASMLRRDPTYIRIYVHWSYLIFLYFIPFTSLAILNAAIYKQVRKANAERQRLSRLQRREIGLATMLLCVVLVFFLCNILPLVVNIMEAFYNIIYDQLVKISNLLVTINSSVNFIIYVIFGEKFKRIFLRLFCSHGLFGMNTGRESPDGTHDDSLMSVAERQSIRLHRQNTTSSRNGMSTRVNGSMQNRSQKDRYNQRTASVRCGRAPSPGPCVYYPANRGCKDFVTQPSQTSVTIITSTGGDSPTSEWEMNGDSKTTGF